MKKKTQSGDLSPFVIRDTQSSFVTDKNFNGLYKNRATGSSEKSRPIMVTKTTINNFKDKSSLRY